MGPLPPLPRRKFTASHFLGLLVILAGIGFLSAPPRPGGRKSAVRTEAINNMKQVSTMLFEFDSEYGRFPDASTAAAVKADSKTPLTLGSASSNQLFRQLLVTGSGKSEKLFWAKISSSKEKPDDIFDSDATALAKGECSFAYIACLRSSDDPAAPLLVAPLIPGTQRFDPKPFQGKALVLSIDNTVTGMKIREDNGEVWVKGMNIFDPRQPYWHGEAPDVKWPE